MRFCKKSFFVALGMVILFSFIPIFAARQLVTGAETGKAPGTGYGRLSLEEACPDREVGAALARAGIDNYISESTQRVFLDDFGELKPVPLDTWASAVEPFDPRNDGYAETLRSFFVHDGKRFFFIPLAGKTDIEGRIAAALGDLPFSFDYILIRRSRPVMGALFIAAAAVTVFLAAGGFSGRAGGGNRGTMLIAAALIPFQGAFALAGPGGFALSAALFALFWSILPPLREFFDHRLNDRKRTDRSVWADRLGVFKISWCMAALFLAAYMVIAVLVPVPALVSVLGLVSFFAILISGLRAEYRGGTGHVRFLPVPIRDPALHSSRFPRIMLPFALASVVSLFMAPFSGESIPAGAFPDAAAYQRHYAFQSSFSFRPLGGGVQDAGDGPVGGIAYRSYYLGEDGLIAGSREEGYSGSGYGDYNEEIFFPLGDLAAFFGGQGVRSGSTRGEFVPVLIILALCVLMLIRSGGNRRKMRGLFFYIDKGDKQAAA